MSSSSKKENKPRSNVLSRFLDKPKNEKPHDTPSFLSAGKQYNNFINHWLTPFRFHVPAESSNIE